METFHDTHADQHGEKPMTDLDGIEIRLLGIQEGAAVARLAELDTAEVPPTPLIGGIVAGQLVAAQSLTTGASIADPFRHTAEIRSLLAERASQLEGRRARGLLSRLRHRLGGDVPARPASASEAIR
jgi:hypothetical protein